MTTKKIPSMPSPLARRLIQAGSPHTAEADRQLAQQTEAVAFRCVGNHLSYSFITYLSTNPDTVPPDALPLATVSALSTWTSFTMSGATSSHTWDIPFRQTEGYGGVGLVFTIFSVTKALFAVRFQTKTLAGHTIPTSTSQVAYIAGGSVPMDVPSICYGAAFHNIIGSGWTDLDSPTLDSTRRFVIEPQIQVADSQNKVIDLGGTIKVQMKGLIVYEYPPRTIGV